MQELTLSALPAVPTWSTLGDVREVEDRLAKVKADLLCEMAAVRVVSGVVGDTAFSCFIP